jgi:hypothetical protein
VQPSSQFTLGEEERKDTGVDFSKTTTFEERALTFDRKEAGYEVEPFNLDAERESGRFDEDFNYVAKRSRRDRVRARLARAARARHQLRRPAAHEPIESRASSAPRVCA